MTSDPDLIHAMSEAAIETLILRQPDAGYSDHAERYRLHFAKALNWPVAMRAALEAYRMTEESD